MKNIYSDAWLLTNVELYELVILTVVIVQDIFSKKYILRHKEHNDICITEHWYTDWTQHSYTKGCVLI